MITQSKAITLPPPNRLISVTTPPPIHTKTPSLASCPPLRDLPHSRYSQTLQPLVPNSRCIEPEILKSCLGVEVLAVVVMDRGRCC